MRTRLPLPVRTAALVATLAVALAACGGSGDGATEAKVDGSAATLDTTTTVEVPPTTPTTEVPTTDAEPVGLPEQDDVATRLYDAWVANDKITAATVADPIAIEGIWLADPGSYYLYNRCSSGEFDTSGCLFRGNPGTIQIDLEKRGENWVVSGAFFSPPGSD